MKCQIGTPRLRSRLPIPKGKGKGKWRWNRQASQASYESLLDSAFTDLIEQHRKNCDTMETTLQDPPTPLRVEYHLFLACAERMKKMSLETSSQLQVAHIFFNAENMSRHLCQKRQIHQSGSPGLRGPIDTDPCGFPRLTVTKPWTRS